jgi:hypothetical protein
MFFAEVDFIRRSASREAPCNDREKIIDHEGRVGDCADSFRVRGYCELDRSRCHCPSRLNGLPRLSAPEGMLVGLASEQAVNRSLTNMIGASTLVANWRNS